MKPHLYHSKSLLEIQIIFWQSFFCTNCQKNVFMYNEKEEEASFLHLYDTWINMMCSEYQSICQHCIKFITFVGDIKNESRRTRYLAMWSTPHTVHDERMKNATYYVAILNTFIGQILSVWSDSLQWVTKNSYYVGWLKKCSLTLKKPLWSEYVIM